MIMIKGSMLYKCERIATTYIETGRTMRSLASQYKCDVHTIHRYLHDYAMKYLSYDVYQQIKARAKQNMQEVYYLGQSENRYSDELGSMD